MKILKLLESNLRCATSSSSVHAPWLDARIIKLLYMDRL